MSIAKEKQEIKEMNIITDKEKKIYFKYPMSIDELKDEKDIENLLYEGIKVSRATLSGRIEELGMLENLRKYRPDILQAYLGGREFDPIDMGAEADLKRLLAEYSTNKGADITCILEIPKDCKYVNYIKSLQPAFVARLSDGQIRIPSQFIKAIVTKEDTGYRLWKGQNYSSRFSLKRGLLEEKELNRIVHNLNPVATKETVLEDILKLFKKEFLITGNVDIYKQRLANLRKIYDAKKVAEETPVKEEEVIREPLSLTVCEEKTNPVVSFFKKVKKLIFGGLLAGKKDY